MKLLIFLTQVIYFLGNVRKHLSCHMPWRLQSRIYFICSPGSVWFYLCNLLLKVALIHFFFRSWQNTESDHNFPTNTWIQTIFLPTQPHSITCKQYTTNVESGHLRVQLTNVIHSELTDLIIISQSFTMIQHLIMTCFLSVWPWSIDLSSFMQQIAVGTCHFETGLRTDQFKSYETKWQSFIIITLNHSFI